MKVLIPLITLLITPLGLSYSTLRAHISELEDQGQGTSPKRYTLDPNQETTCIRELEERHMAYPPKVSFGFRV